jgi:uncharacterized protein YbaP (TraB family)
MRRYLAALSLLFGSVTAAHAQSAVWAIQGTQNTVYLAGSVHLLKPDNASLPAVFEKAYTDAEALVMELDLDDFDPLSAQSWMLENGTFKSDTTLRESLGETRYKRVSTEATRLGLPLEALQNFEPWAIALTLVQLQYMKLGFDPEAGVEKQLERRAREEQKPIQGLETLDQQLGQLDSLTYEQQGRFLELTVEEMHEMESDTDDMLRAWRAGDIKALSTLLSAEYDDFPELYRALVTERNKRWMPKIEALLKDKQDYMVVVGALHLVGDDGLLDLARKRGLKPSPVQARN